MSEGAGGEGGRDDSGDQVFRHLPGGGVFPHQSQFYQSSLSSQGDQQIKGNILTSRVSDHEHQEYLRLGRGVRMK